MLNQEDWLLFYLSCLTRRRMHKIDAILKSSNSCHQLSTIAFAICVSGKYATIRLFLQRLCNPNATQNHSAFLLRLWRCSTISAICSDAHSTIGRQASMNDSPRVLRAYCTRGGTSANTVCPELCAEA